MNVAKVALKWFISILIGGLFVWLAIRGVDLDQVATIVTGADQTIVLWYVLVFAVIQLSRTFRWGVLLKPIGRVSFGRLFVASQVGFMALVVLPLRLGEFARPLLVAEKGKLRMSAALATIVVERVIDAVSMAALLVVLLFFLDSRVVAVPEDLRIGAWLVLLGFLGLLGFLFFAYWRQASTVAWTERVLGRLSPKVGLRVASILRSFLSGLRSLPDLKLQGLFLLWTVIYWGLSGLGMWLFFLAFPGLEVLGAFEAFAVLSVLCVGLLIPAGPGMIGNFHYFVRLGLALFVSDQVLGTSGVAYAILLHAVQIGLQLLVGVICMFTGGIGLRDLVPSLNGSGDLDAPSSEPAAEIESRLLSASAPRS